ncbi:MAG: DUF4389 domain-containing protein, partial [Elusimicrobia bacterium]|nr:DUF4389 domain-containing protein [Elusimicrobiota bacterium]
MNSVKITVASEAQASRLELFVRIVWGSIVGFVLGFIGIGASVALVVQWFHILFLGRRQAGLQKFINAYGVAMAQLKFYCLLTTDERPP